MSMVPARPTGEPRWLRWLLITLALLFLGLNLALPLAAVFVEGLRKGVAAYAAASSLSAFYTNHLGRPQLSGAIAGLSLPLSCHSHSHSHSSRCHCHCR